MAELVPIPFDLLLRRIYLEYTKNKAIFDLPERQFYRPAADVDLSVTFCGNRAANPLGPAAGPQTQLTQNIILSWLAGSRILELKTVQVNDRLELTRPCIDMATVGYNTEWSQELRLEDSLREYVKGSMIIDILKHSFRHSGIDFHAPPSLQSRLETILDVSVGYDLAGIQSASVCTWLDSMKNARKLVDEFRNQIPDEFRKFRDLRFNPEISNSITLSTFHGTPANEIERICEFLLLEMGYHVIIKMNPPMLGKDRIEHLLFETLGYSDVMVHEKVYEVNITFSDAVDVVRRLESVASRAGKTIGVKFGNTLEVINTGKFLKDKIQYLSGRPLHILHLALVEEWRKVFGPRFPVSFSAGIDENNVAAMVGTGCAPITSCTDLLRPGGYGRMQKYLLNLERGMRRLGAKTISEFVVRVAEHEENQTIADLSKSAEPELGHDSLHDKSILSNTSSLLRRSLDDPRYHSTRNRNVPRKIGSHLHLWDCINCDKCIPVCPNDANFSFEIEPVEIIYKNVEIENGEWNEAGGGVFRVEEAHQIATFADACNDCGNCDIFCPEDGGPYLEKPRFFGTVETYRKWKSLGGFVLTRKNETVILLGRFNEKEFELAFDEQNKTAIFANEHAQVKIDRTTHAIRSVLPKSPSTRALVDLSFYFVMDTLLEGILNPERVHFVNSAYLES